MRKPNFMKWTIQFVIVLTASFSRAQVNDNIARSNYLAARNLETYMKGNVPEVSIDTSANNSKPIYFEGGGKCV